MKHRNVYAASLSNRCFNQRIVRVKKRDIIERELDKGFMDYAEETKPEETKPEE